MIRRGCWIAGLLLVTTAAQAEDAPVSAGPLHVAQDRKIAQQAEAAANHLARGETARALSLLERLWLDSRDALTGEGAVLEAVRDRVIRLTSQIPELEQQRFWKRIESAGDRSDAEWRGAPTRAGLGVLWRTAARLRDHGEFELAAAAFDQAARHPAATTQESLLAGMQRLDSLAQTHGPQVVTDWLFAADAAVLRKPLRIGGKATTVADWLQRRASQLNAPLPKDQQEFDRPALTPTWQHAAESPADLLAGLRHAGEELRSEGVLRLPATPPLIVGSRVVVRTPTGLDCREIASGKLLWTLTDRLTGERAALAAQQQNPLFRHKLLSGIVQRMETNTLLGAMSSDETTIYRIIEVEAAAAPQNGPVDYAVEAVDLETGRPKWRIGGAKKSQDDLWRAVSWTSPSAEKNAAPPVVSVSGPPLVLGDRLCLLCEAASELRLLAVQRETLQVDWSVDIGHFLPDADRSMPNTYTGCSPIWTGTLLMCPTGVGVLAAVDPIQRTVPWIARIPVEDMARPPADSTYADLSAAKAALAGWRGVTLLHADGTLIFSTPESSWVHRLDAATGRTLSKIPRGNGLKLLGVAGERVLILEPAAIRAHDLSTGVLAWRTVTGEIRGQGMLVGDHVVQPLAAGSTAVLDIETGRRSPGTIRSATTWGHLVRAADGWITADEFQVARFADLAALKTSPIPNAAELELARRDSEAGDFAAARRRLLTVDEESARKLRWENDLAELQFAPQRGQELEEALRKSSSSREDSGEVLAALAEAALRQADGERVVKLCLEGLDLGVNGERIVSEESVRVVRWDRLFSGLISAALRDASPAQRQRLEDLLATHWQAARKAGDPFTLQQLYQRSRGLAWTRREFLADTSAVFLGSRLLSQELSLREAADSGNPSAWWTLRQEWLAAGFPRDAEDIEFHLFQATPGQPVAGDGTVRRHLADRGAAVGRLLHRLNAGPADSWPLNSPRVTVTKDIYDDAHQMTIPIVADPDSLWDRLDVTVDRQGRTLRFTGDGRPGAWTLALPRSSSPFPWTDRGWGHGRLLILRIGSRLLGVTPFDEHGAAVANVLWSLDLLDSTGWQSTVLTADPLAPRWKLASEQPYRIRLPFGREFAAVGPVRPGYLCFQRHGKLIAVETQTGRQLWERWDVAPGTLLLGDDEHVLLWQLDRQTVEVLDAVDGRTIRRQTCDFAFADVWHESGSTVWTGRLGPELTIGCVDLIADCTVWQRTFPRGSLPIALDQQTAGVIDPRGLLHLLDLATGEPFEEAMTVELPPVIDKVILSRDEARWYLGVSGPSQHSLDWQQAQPLNGFRRPLLNGPLYALDRSLRQIVWKRSIDGEPWPLDQNRTTPVLTQIYKSPSPHGQNIGDGVLRLIDKRTGRDVFTHRDLNLLPNFSIEPNADWQKFEVRTERTAFQFDYRPAAEE